MEPIKNEMSISNPNIIILKNCRYSDSESEKFNSTSSIDSENYPHSSMEISNFYIGKLNDTQNNLDGRPTRLNSVPENINDEQSSSMIDINFDGANKYLMKFIKTSQQNREKIINKISSNSINSPVFNFENRNFQQKTSLIDKKNKISEKKNNVNKDNQLEADNDKIRVLSNQCICATCQIF